METLVEGMTALMIVIGAVFLFVGSFGLAKLPDTMRRLHGPTKATTRGIGAMPIASMIYFSLVRDSTDVPKLLISIFLFLTASVSANMIARRTLSQTRTCSKTCRTPTMVPAGRR